MTWWRVRQATVVSSLLAAEQRLRRLARIDDPQRAYRSLLEHDPHARPVDRRTRRTIREYSRDHLGSARFAGWLAVYTAHRGEFVEGWLPEDYFGQVVLPLVNGPYRHVGGARTLTRRLLRSDAVPDVAYHLHGRWFDLEGERVDAAQVARIIFAHGDRAVLKLESTRGGEGIRFISRDRFDPGLPPGVNAVVQRVVRHDPWFDAVMPDSTVTLRILTRSADDGPTWSGGSMKVSRQGEGWVMPPTQISAPVMDMQGTLAPWALDASWRRHARHPDTAFRFEGARVPRYAEAVELCTRLHGRVPQFGVIGWDVAIPDRAPVQVLEWNIVHPSVRALEATTGPWFADLTPPLKHRRWNRDD